MKHVFLRHFNQNNKFITYILKIVCLLYYVINDIEVELFLDQIHILNKGN
jgi:hypothetical protein